MLAAVFEVIIGLLILLAGGEGLLRGAVSLAVRLRLTPAVIGLTVVAAGTSVPELSVSAVAAWSGKVDIAVGNVVGSNLFNLAIILGLVAVYRRLSITSNTLRFEYPLLAAATIFFICASRQGLISRGNGALFLLIYAATTALLIQVAKRQLSDREKQQFSGEVNELNSSLQRLGSFNTWSFILGGVALLGWGADLVVTGASTIGSIIGLSDRVIGLTIIAGGTSLPEIVTSLVSAYRGRNDIAVANVVGSNLFNILVILGMSSVIHPLAVAPEIVSRDNWWLLGVTIVVYPIIWTGRDVTRKEGVFLIGLYLIYLAQLLAI